MKDIKTGAEMAQSYRDYVARINADIEEVKNSSLSKYQKHEFTSLLLNKKMEYIRGSKKHAETLLKTFTDTLWGNEKDLEKMLPVIEILFDLDPYLTLMKHAEQKTTN